MNPFLAIFNNEPALLEPSMQAVFEACVQKTGEFAAMMEAKGVQVAAAAGSEGFWFPEGDWRQAYRPYKVANGILSIPVEGVLLNKFPWAIGYATGYEYIHQAMLRGMADDSVKGIALVIDSPGGMVSGNFDLVDRMFAMRGEKPIKAFASDSAYSAAYSIASAADKISVSRSGGVGSVGVVTTHVDYSGALADAGIKVTFIFAGKHKVDGNSYEPLPEDVRTKIQGRIDALYADFVSIVARNRDMDEKAVRATEADTFMASEAIENGLADEAGAFEDAFAAFTANVNSNDEDSAMADQTKAQITEEALAAAEAAAKSAGFAEGEAKGYADAMTRINAIIGSDEGKKRPNAALNAALKTSMKVEEATAFLATLAEEGKPEAKPQGAGAPTGMFSESMDKTKNPNVKAEGDDDQDEEQAKVAGRSALIRSAGLPGFKSKE